MAGPKRASSKTVADQATKAGHASELGHDAKAASNGTDHPSATPRQTQHHSHPKVQTPHNPFKSRTRQQFPDTRHSSATHRHPDGRQPISTSGVDLTAHTGKVEQPTAVTQQLPGTPGVTTHLTAVPSASLRRSTQFAATPRSRLQHKPHSATPTVSQAA